MYRKIFNWSSFISEHLDYFKFYFAIDPSRSLTSLSTPVGEKMLGVCHLSAYLGKGSSLLTGKEGIEELPTQTYLTKTQERMGGPADIGL